MEPADKGAEWGSLAFPVPKKTKGSWRLVVDFRMLNEVTVADVFPLPLIDTILNKHGHSRVFSVLDLKHGFYQVPLASADRSKTAFVTSSGLYQWRVMPMGLKNAPARFQRIMTELFRHVQSASPYMDDLIVSSAGDTLEEALTQHKLDLFTVLGFLRTNSFFVEAKKCRFFLSEVEFCGHILSAGIRRASPGKLAVVSNWPPPRTVRALRGFLGLCGHYSPYVPRYAELAAALSDLLKLESVVWFNAEDQAFQALKKVLLDTVVLRIVRPDAPFFIRSDASSVAVGGVLEQHSEEGELRPVAFYSRKLRLRSVSGPLMKQRYMLLSAACLNGNP